MKSLVLAFLAVIVATAALEARTCVKPKGARCADGKTWTYSPRCGCN